MSTKNTAPTGARSLPSREILETLIDEQRGLLWGAAALIRNTEASLRIGENGAQPTEDDLSQARYALRAVAKLVDDASGALEMMALENAADLRRQLEAPPSRAVEVPAPEAIQ